MRACPTCNTSVEDNAAFCPNCGTRFAQSAPQQPYGYGQNPAYAPAYDPYDHTAEFDAKDISDNKVYCMGIYLLGAIGIIIALLASGSSEYTKFHIRQMMKFIVLTILVGIVTVVLFWTVIVPIAAGIFLCVLSVLQIICFFQIGQGKAKEPAIIRSLKFLR